MRWKPALDVTSIVLRAQAGVIVLLLMMLRARRGAEVARGRAPAIRRLSGGIGSEPCP